MALQVKGGRQGGKYSTSSDGMLSTAKSTGCVKYLGSNRCAGSSAPQTHAANSASHTGPRRRASRRNASRHSAVYTGARTVALRTK